MATLWPAAGYYDGALRRFPFIHDGADVRKVGHRTWRWTCRQCPVETYEQATATSCTTVREDLAAVFELLEVHARAHAHRYHRATTPVCEKSSTPRCHIWPLGTA